MIPVEADTAPMRPTIPSTAALAAALLTLGLCSGCSQEQAEPVESTSPTEESSEPRGKTFEELLGIGKGDEKGLERPTQDLPVLGFQSNSEGLPTFGTWREHPTLCDLDGDGRADLIASNREENGLNIWRSVPGSAWVPAREGVPDDLMYGGSDCADLDGDGDVDVLFAAHKRGLHTLLNEGQQGWKVLEGTSEMTFLSLDVAIGNLNGDDIPDAATISQFVERRAGAVGIYFGRGDGTFEYQPQLRNTTGESDNGVQVEMADIDGDGLDDLFLTAEWGCRLLLPRLTAEGEVRLEDRSQGLPEPPFNMGNALRSFVPIDVDGDGQLEIAFSSLINHMLPIEERHSLGLRRWNEEAQSWEQFGSGLPDGWAHTDVLTADFDQDGNADLLAIGHDLGASIYLGDGTGHFEAKGMLEGTLSGGRCALGDIDGDGRTDVAVINGDTKSRPRGGGVKTFLNREEAW